MRFLQVSLFLVSVLILAAQGVRHTYRAYFEPRTSVLDKYDESGATDAVRKAGSLEELVALYDVAKKRVDELDKQLREAKENKTKDEREFIEEKFNEDHGREYARAAQLGSAIREWEERAKQVTELYVFWAFGLGLFVLGALLLSVRQEWLGMSLIIPGVVEMLWWTSPSIRFDGCPVEFDRLLLNKIVFTVITLAVIIVAWVLSERRRKATR